MPPLTISSSLTQNIFGLWQSEYAQRGLATFPVRIDGKDKVPMTRGYQRTGLRGSAELARRFGEAGALGIALNSRRMVVDIDTTSESVLADVLAKHGDTPLVARTASKGGFHVYYGANEGAWRHYERSRRAIRPEADRPVDFLGAGFIVVPPSLTATGQYEFIRGGLDDVARLPPFHGIVPLLQNQDPRAASEVVVGILTGVREGARNNTLWRDCMKRLLSGATQDELLAFARTTNVYYKPPLGDAEVIKTVMSAWAHRDRNYFGQFAARFPVEEVDELLREPDAFLLLAFLRAHNTPKAQFYVANGLSRRMGWGEGRLRAARQRLLDFGYIEQIRPASQHVPTLYQWRVCTRGQ
jgi:hypothetical protein